MKIFSIIFGFILGYILMKIYVSNVSNVTYRGPNSNNIKKNIYFDNDKEYCYQFIPNVCICPIGTKIN